MVERTWEGIQGPDARLLVSLAAPALVRYPHLDIFHEAFIAEVFSSNDPSSWINIGYRVE